MQNKIPVLFVIFNRPEIALESFQSIKRYKPDRLYIAADGPRKEKAGEVEICRLTREGILNQIDWTCDVRTLFREENVGCGRGVADGISWMFETEEYGAIIEDDCVVTDTFFTFCEEILPRYATNDKVAQVNCWNTKTNKKESSEYYFTDYPNITAWATWKRAWKHMDFEMTNWPQVRYALFRRFPLVEACIHYLLWRKVYRKIKRGEKSNVWDYQWSIYVFMNHKLCVEPEVNLVRNIGFGENSTNCPDADSPLAKTTFGHLSFPLKHPAEVCSDLRRERRNSTLYVRYYTWLLFKKILNH